MQNTAHANYHLGYVQKKKHSLIRIYQIAASFKYPIYESYKHGDFNSAELKKKFLGPLKVGILGGGQLGRMLLQAAANYVVETFVLGK